MISIKKPFDLISFARGKLFAKIIDYIGIGEAEIRGKFVAFDE